MNIADALFLPMFIGIGHSLEADHLVAVGNLVNVRGDWTKEASRGAVWGLGHTVSVMIAAACVGFLRVVLGQEQNGPFEILVGIMLLIIGLLKLYKVMAFGQDQGGTASKKVFFQVGLVHGLAGSGAVAVLLSGHVSQPWQQFQFLAWFGLGTMLGMAIVSAVLTRIGFVKHSLVSYYSILVASISVIYGLIILYQQTLKPFMS
jgi:hypothetical protein